MFRPVRRARRLACVTAAMALAFAGLAATPATAARPETFLTVVGGGDHVGGSAARLFHPGNATIHVTGNARFLTVSAWGGTHGDDFTLTLAAPEGHTLVPGVYEHARRNSFQGSAWPGLSLSGAARACNESEGRFEVFDMATGADGVINRFSATYEHHCGGDESAIGQVSVNSPAASDVLVAANVNDWGGEYPLVPGRTVPVWLVNRGTVPVTVEPPVVSGVSAAAFELTSNGCSVLGAGKTCAMHLRFTPLLPGPHEATLEVTASGAPREVPLRGRGIGGYTAFHLRSEQRDYVGQGGSYDYTPANAAIDAGGSPERVAMSVRTATAWWDATLVAAPGTALRPGTYVDPPVFPFGSAEGLSISGNGRGCDTQSTSFTISEVTYRDGTGPVETFSATVEQRCAAGGPALRGWLNWRAADTAIPPRVTDPVMPPDPVDPQDPAGPAVPPAPVTPVTSLRATPGASSVALAWENPGGSFARVVVRGAPGLAAPATPAAGVPVYDGTAETAAAGALAPGTAYSFSAFALDAAGDAAAPATVTVRGTALRLASSRAVVAHGSSATLTMRLADASGGGGLAGRAVELSYRRRGTEAFTRYGSFPTDAYGAAVATVRPATTYEWRATFAGGGSHTGATSAPFVLGVRHAVSATLGRSTIPLGATVALTGAVGPAQPGQLVYLQRYYAGAWRTVAFRPLSAASTYTFPIRPNATGSWPLRVHKPAYGDVAAGLSPVRTVRIA